MSHSGKPPAGCPAFARSIRPLAAAALGAVLAVAVLGVRPSAAQASQDLSPLPLTEIDERARAADFDNHAFSLTFAQPVPIGDLLFLLVRGTGISLVPDPSVAGSFVGELKNVTIRRALDLILPRLGLAYSAEGSVLRVFRREPETRLFDVNYIAGARSTATSVGGAVDDSGSSVRVTTTTAGDVFGDIAKGVQTLLSERGTFNLDRAAGLLQVTDFQERLDRVDTYLDRVHERVHRQVQIDARIIELAVGAGSPAVFDWNALAQPAPAVLDASAARRAAPGIRVGDLQRLLAALGAQGKMSLLSSPRVLALNNEPAVVRASWSTAGESEAVTIGVVPQIAGDGMIMLSLSPLVRVWSAGPAGAPRTWTLHETEMLARVRDGDTVIVAGFARDQETDGDRRKKGKKADAARAAGTRTELFLLLTPTIVP